MIMKCSLSEWWVPIKAYLKFPIQPGIGVSMLGWAPIILTCLFKSYILISWTKLHSKTCLDLSHGPKSPEMSKTNYSFCGINDIKWFTLPETNSSQLRIRHPKRQLVFQPSLFRCELLVSGRVDVILEWFLRSQWQELHRENAGTLGWYPSCLSPQGAL